MNDTSTHGYRRQDPLWHSQLDGLETIAEVVAMMRDFTASLTPEQLLRLPPSCQPLRVKAEDDIEYWTCKLSGCFPSSGPEQAQLVQDLFMHFLHASMRICEIRRTHAQLLDVAAFPDGM